jgi:NAD(P) transhydrogenase
VKHYDIIVLGAGPGGEGAAMTAAKAGKKIAIVDRHDYIGGGCVHYGTIPSKALRQAIWQVQQARTNPLLAQALDDANITFPDLMKSTDGVIARQVRMRRTFYERNNVRAVDGHGRFVDEHTVAVTNEGGVMEMISGDFIVVATGTSPWRPADIDFDHPRVRDANTILQLDDTPQSITIYGAGVIGCEYASIFRNMGAKLNLVNSRDKLLSFLDDEIIDALAYHLRDQGAILRHNETYDRVLAHDDHVELHLKSGKVLKSDILLWAAGRTGNTSELGLENAGLEANNREQMNVDENYATKVPHIYAVGDVIGMPGLASASYDQGRFAAGHIVTGRADRKLVANIPSGIYTIPEISSVGPTERELTEDCVPYEVGHALFRSLARAQIVDVRVGMLKILFHRETYEILAIHCFGYQAAEIVHIGQAIMSQEGAANDIRYFTDTTFNYPTMAEAYRVAALNGINRL